MFIMQEHLIKGVLLFMLLVGFSEEQEDYVIVNTSIGNIRGLAGRTVSGLPLYSFKGIPYAEPPVGLLRFQPPLPKAGWDGIRDALEGGSKCVQNNNGTIEGQEDCLFLNVYMPQEPSSSLLPVMVYVHGGGFLTGHGLDLGPDYFVEAGVILVTVNYRLGPLGFLSTEDMHVPGNMGLKDQVEALKWVHQNIVAFGGNPENITIFGQSAGGSSIHYLLLSPMTKGFYKRAIAQSGSALSPWAFARNTRTKAFLLAESLGYSAENTTDLIQFLLSVDATQLVKDIYAAIPPEDKLALFQCVFVPSVEPEHEGAFLTVEPEELLNSGLYNDVPYITGGTSAECLFYIVPPGDLSTEEDLYAMDKDFELFVGPDLRLPTVEQRTEGAREVRQFYYKDSPITLKENQTTVSFTSTLLFGEGIDTVVRKMAQHSTQPIYYYHFSFVGSRPLTQYPEYGGASHGDDVNYINYWGNGELLEPGTPSATTRWRIIQMWTNFAKYGHPTPYLDSLITEEWIQYTPEQTAYLEIDDNLRIGYSLKEEEFNFWHTLLP